MGAETIAFVSGFPRFLASTAITGVLLMLAIGIYIKLTPWKEWALINEKKNASAGLALVGAVLGLAISLAACLASSVNLLDLIIWGFVIIFLQLFAYRISEMLMRDLRSRVENDEAGPAIVLLGVKIAIGLLLAAGIVDTDLPQLF